MLHAQQQVSRVSCVKNVNDRVLFIPNDAIHSVILHKSNDADFVYHWL